MADDWRLRITVEREGLAQELRERLEAPELEHELNDAFHDSVAVSGDGNEVFLYAGSRKQAESAGRLVRSLAEKDGGEVELFELRRWHQAAEDWEDPERPLPTSEAGREAEHEELIEQEREESLASGHPEFEVRVQFESHRAAVEFAHKLEQEGQRPVRRWHFLLIGANDEDSAQALAQRVREEAPPGTVVLSEGTQRTVAEGGGGNPFAYFGGLGG
jgi:hypothetical protein